MLILFFSQQDLYVPPEPEVEVVITDLGFLIQMTVAMRDSLPDQAILMNGYASRKEALILIAQQDQRLGDLRTRIERLSDQVSIL